MLFILWSMFVFPVLYTGFCYAFDQVFPLFLTVKSFHRLTWVLYRILTYWGKHFNFWQKILWILPSVTYIQTDEWSSWETADEPLSTAEAHVPWEGSVHRPAVRALCVVCPHRSRGRGPGEGRVFLVSTSSQVLLETSEGPRSTPYKPRH